MTDPGINRPGDMSVVVAVVVMVVMTMGGGDGGDDDGCDGDGVVMVMGVMVW